MSNHSHTPTDLLDDPTVHTVTIEQARQILGIGRSTAVQAAKTTGYLIPGVPVMQVGTARRYIVSTAHLRAALGHPHPTQAVA